LNVIVQWAHDPVRRGDAMAYVLSGQRIGDQEMNEVLGTIAVLLESTVEPHVSCEQRLGDPLPPAGGNAGKHC
jgi:hypothetical protein